MSEGLNSHVFANTLRLANNQYFNAFAWCSAVLLPTNQCKLAERQQLQFLITYFPPEMSIPKFPTNQSNDDHAYQALRAAISTVPGVGGPFQVLFETIFTHPIEKRREKWFEDLREVIEKIKSRTDNFDAEMLAANEAFLTTAMQASQIALRNHQIEKLEALKNAILNSGLYGSPSEDEQAIFLHLIDQLTAWHLRILSILDDPVAWLNRQNREKPSFNASAGALLEYCFPVLAEQKDLYSQMVKDLQSAGLASSGSYMTSYMSNDGVLSSRTTAIGKRFIAFISDSCHGEAADGFGHE